MPNDVENLKTYFAKLMESTKELAHGIETLDWLLKIEPKAPWHLQIAAFAHDIERAIPFVEGKTPQLPSKDAYPDYDDYKAAHAKRSAEIVKTIMAQFGFNTYDITVVSSAIEKHEVGGDPNSDLVRDADSIRWFDGGYINYINKYSVEGAKEKGWWMFKRAREETQKLILKLPFDAEVKAHILEYKKLGEPTL